MKRDDKRLVQARQAAYDVLPADADDRTYELADRIADAILDAVDWQIEYGRWDDAVLRRLHRDESMA